VRIESYHGWDRPSLARPFHYGTHDQLVAKMQTVKHAERQDRRSLNLSVVSSVK
jgi:hypothetical protein